MMFRNNHDAALARMSALEAENKRLHEAAAAIRATRQRSAFAKVSPEIAAITIEAMNAIADALIEEGLRGDGRRAADPDHDAVLRRIALLEAENDLLAEEMASGAAIRMPERVPEEVSVPALAAAIALGRTRI